MRIAITGATGNAGTALLRRLRAEPEVTSVVGLSRRPPDTTKSPYDRVEWVHLDVADPRSLPTMADAFAEADAVVHLAWRIQPSHDEPAMRRTNVDGTRQVTAAAVTANVPHLVVASSVGAYSPGPKDAPVTEDWPTGGIHGSAYSQHKSAVERGLDAVQTEYPELIITRVRPGLVFQAEAGSEIARYFLGPLLPVSIIGKVRPPVLPLPHQFVFQAVHADDLAEAYWLLLSGRHGGAFNAAADPVLTPNDLAQAIGAKRAVPLPVAALRGLAWATWRAHLQPTDPGWIDLAANSPVMSTARLRQLGWTPSRSSQQALTDLVTGISTATGTDSPPMRPRQALSDRSE
jgi:UDP-glucose 4-epimerase